MARNSLIKIPVAGGGDVFVGVPVLVGVAVLVGVFVLVGVGVSEGVLVGVIVGRITPHRLRGDNEFWGRLGLIN